MAQGVMDYLLGENPLRFSYISGYGADGVRNIYSCIYSFDGVAEIPPGYLAGGPNKFEGGAYSRFAGKCYRDTNADWVTNEQAIYWNSPLVFTAAVLCAK